MSLDLLYFDKEGLRNASSPYTSVASRLGVSRSLRVNSSMAAFCPVEGDELIVYPTSVLQTEDGLEDLNFLSE